jgi:hypothetical protein
MSRRAFDEQRGHVADTKWLGHGQDIADPTLLYVCA